MKYFYPLIIVILFLAFSQCAIKKDSSQSSATETDSYQIALGSCINTTDPEHGAEQPIWKPILAESPDLWLWLGDIIYADINGQLVDSIADIERMRGLYAAQKEHPSYTALMKNTAVMGMYDDHDYGDNNAGKEFPFKAEARDLLYDFLDIAEGSTARQKEGAYYSEMHGTASIQVKSIMLDSRYFRDTPVKEGRNYMPEKTKGTILGEEQWDWLEAELSEAPKADLYLISNGIQVIPEDHRFEKWANFPEERKRLLNLLDRQKDKNILLLSGDRHIAEISKIDLSNGSFYELTSSGMTHSYDSFTSEENRHRVGSVVSSLNYGSITLTRTDGDLKADIGIGTMAGIKESITIDLID